MLNRIHYLFDSAFTLGIISVTQIDAETCFLNVVLKFFDKDDFTHIL